jgi:hypothetical protein
MSDQRDDNTTHPSTKDSTRAGPSWVDARLLNSDQVEFEIGSLIEVIVFVLMVVIGCWLYIHDVRCGCISEVST